MNTTTQMLAATTHIDVNVIPPITDPMGKHWDQPSLDGILIDDTHALMSRADVLKLLDYSHSQPSGVYPGKMWRQGTGDRWWLCWFGLHPDPKYCTNHSRKILIADDAF